MAARERRSEGVSFSVTVRLGTACCRVLPSGRRFSGPVLIRLWPWMGCPDSLLPTGSNSSENRGRKCYTVTVMAPMVFTTWRHVLSA